MARPPLWLHFLAWGWIIICLACTAIILMHTLRKPQKMTIMGLVWPITALYLGPVAVYLYMKSLPVMTRHPMSPQMQALAERTRKDPPTFFQNSVAVFHCGAGCSLGDIVAETLVPALGLMFAGPVGSRLIVDFLLAYAFGIAFQYFTIVPMRGLSFGKGLVAAARADTISIALFEVGMFAWMAFTYFWLFPSPHLHPGMAEFWFMMQIAMVIGFFTALPANAWLIRKGWKEKMPQVDPNQALALQSDLNPPQRRASAA